jgi:hypothetical protein
MILLTAVPTGLFLWTHVNPMIAFPILWAPLFLIPTVIGRSVALRRRDKTGQMRDIRKRDLATATLALNSLDGSWSICLNVRDGPVRFVGEEALRVVRSALALSIHDVTPEVLQAAMLFIREPRFASGTNVFAAFATPDAEPPRPARWTPVILPGTIESLPNHHRVALEILSTEILERSQALHDTKQIASEWDSADVIASIADDLFLPEEVVREFERIKRGGS